MLLGKASHKVLLPKNILSIRNKEELNLAVSKYMQRYPEYYFLRIEDDFAICSREQPVKQHIISTDKLLLIDGSNVLHIAYHASKDNVRKTKEGLYTNAVYIFLLKLLNILKELQPTHLAVCWDKSKNTFRKQLYSNYKSNRNEKPPELTQQFKTTQDLLSVMNIQQFSLDEFEADDIIGTLAKSWTNHKKAICYIASNDKDLYQLLNEKTIQVTSKKGNTQKYYLDDFSNDYGVTPTQWIDIKALLGDKTDSIPGVKGVGEKAAFPLIRKYSSIEKLYDDVKELEQPFTRYIKPLTENKEMAFLSKILATIVTNISDLQNINLELLKIKINKREMVLRMRELELHSLLRQIQMGAFKAS